MNTNTPLKPLISLPPNQCNEINGLWEHHKMKKGLFYMKKLLSNSYSEDFCQGLFYKDTDIQIVPYEYKATEMTAHLKISL